MTVVRGMTSRRSGFTLVELLTVVGIISLLIGILVPSLARARDTAKRTKTDAELSAIEKALEMFQNDFKQYPESSYRQDPLYRLPNTTSDNAWLTGGHWLARAMSGPDTQGVDTGGYFMRDRDQVTVNGGKIETVQSGGTGIDFIAVGRELDRKGSYLETSKILFQDTDRSKFVSEGPTGGRFLILDAFDNPILYYRANSRARMPFSDTSRNGDMLGVYNLRDNGVITGDSQSNGWDFQGTGMKHGLGYFASKSQTQIVQNPNDVENPVPLPHKGKAFADYLHDHATHTTGQVLKAVRPDSYVLISSGKDSLFGTDDDINNFNR